MRIDFLNTPLCLCVSLFVYVCADCLSSKGEDRLFRRLFRRYNQFIRPVENVSDPVTVEFEVSMSQLVKVVRQTIILETHDPMLKLCLNKGAIPWKRFVRSRIKRNVYLKKKSVSYGLSNYTWLKEKRKHTLLVVFTGEIVAVCCCWLFWFFVSFVVRETIELKALAPGVTGSQTASALSPLSCDSALLLKLLD